MFECLDPGNVGKISASSMILSRPMRRQLSVSMPCMFLSRPPPSGRLSSVSQVYIGDAMSLISGSKKSGGRLVSDYMTLSPVTVDTPSRGGAIPRPPCRLHPRRRFGSPIRIVSQTFREHIAKETVCCVFLVARG